MSMKIMNASDHRSIDVISSLHSLGLLSNVPPFRTNTELPLVKSANSTAPFNNNAKLMYSPLQMRCLRDAGTCIDTSSLDCLGRWGIDMKLSRFT